MTTPEDPGLYEDKPAAAPAPRAQRSEPQRQGPKRGLGTAAVTGAAPGADQAQPPAVEPVQDPTISEAVAEAVKTGYGAITENIMHGRMAAKRFREGRYNVRDVPLNVQFTARTLVRLARQLSVTTLDICERLIDEIPISGPPSGHVSDVPPFRPTATKAAPAGPAAPQKAPDLLALPLAVRFVGASNASAAPQMLRRPTRPTAPTDVTAAPLASRAEGVTPIADISFEADLATGGLTAVVTAPAGQAPGVYSGLVYAKGDDTPLGVLSIELAP